MPPVWRLVKKRRLTDAMTGIGCDYAPMRWNFQGSRMVYTSESKSLCLLEMLVNVNFEDIPSEEFVFLEIDIPDDVAVYELFEVDLPDGWDSHPSPESLRELGQQWLEDKSYAVLIVPSAITQESNFLINPIHPDFSKISVKEHELKNSAVNDEDSVRNCFHTPL